MADKLSEYFNSLANVLGVAEISPEELQSSLQSEIDRQFSIWINLARVAVLGLLGSDQEMHVAMDRYSNTFQPNIEVALFQVLTISSDGLMPERSSLGRSYPGRIYYGKLGYRSAVSILLRTPNRLLSSWLITNGSNVKPIGVGSPRVTKSERRSANDGASE